MTSKRLGILLFILAFVWSLAGLGSFTSSKGTSPDGVFGVGTAQADPSSWGSGSANSTFDGDPDAFANTPNGDPDGYTGPPAPSDSTGTNPGGSGGGSGGRVPSLWNVLMSIGSSILGLS